MAVAAPPPHWPNQEELTAEKSEEAALREAVTAAEATPTDDVTAAVATSSPES